MAENETAVMLTDPAAIEQREREITLKISMPGTITLGIWETYFKGRQDAIAADKEISSLAADYFGALAVMRKGLVHIDGLPALQRIVDKDNSKQSDVPAAIVGLIVRVVARPIERAFGDTFLTWIDE